MLRPPIPENEEARLEALKNLDILDSPAEERFDQVTRLAALVYRVPIALVSMVDSNRQWFKSCIGLDVAETGRDVSFCGHAIAQDKMLIIPDAREDDRFNDNPLVVGRPHIRFYAGRVLHSPEGFPIGTLCLIDTKPRTLDSDDISRLDALGQWVEMELVQRHAGGAESLTQAINRHKFWAMSKDLFCIAGQDGYFKDISPSFSALLGHSEQDLLTHSFLDYVHPEDLAPTMAELERLTDGLETLHFRNRFRHKRGHYIWLDWAAVPQGNALFAVARDISTEVQHENRMQRVLIRLQEQGNQLRDFTRIVSHDLRVPLRHLQQSGAALTPEVKETIQNLESMIDRLVEYEKVLLGDAQNDGADLDETMAEVLDVFRTELPADSCSSSKELGRVKGSADHWLIVFRNLVDNSIKYQQPDTPLQISLDSIIEDDCITIQYRDNGQGIPSKKREAIWEPFNAVTNGRVHGLGLAMVKRILSRYDATIREVPASEGAHFIITAIPATQPVPA